MINLLSVIATYLLRKDWPLGSLVSCVVFTCAIVSFPIWCPGSRVVLDCIDS